MNRYFCFHVTLDLHNPVFSNHELVKNFKGKEAILESSGFKDYKQCVACCTQILNKVAEDLRTETNKHFNVLWEANPASNLGMNFITPADKWLEGEIIKVYIIHQHEVPVTFNTLEALATAVIYSGQRDIEVLN